MSTKKECCYSGRGKIYVRPWVCLDAETLYNPNPFRHIGNALSLELSISETEFSVPDRTSCAGGVECYASIIDGVSIEAVLTCWETQNLAKGLFGTSYDIAAGTVAGEPYTSPNNVTDDWFIPLVNIPTEGTLVVAGYVEGVDYIVTGGGILFYGSLNGGTVPADTAFTVDYDFDAQECIPLLTDSPSEVEIFFDGENCSSGRPFRFTLCRVRCKPFDTIPFISGDEFAELNFVGSALKDPSKKAIAGGLPFSQYGKISR